MCNTCEKCGAEIGESFQDELAFLQLGMCVDCAATEDPTFEPEELDFRDHSHELQPMEEEDSNDDAERGT